MIEYSIFGVIFCITVTVNTFVFANFQYVVVIELFSSELAIPTRSSQFQMIFDFGALQVYENEM